MYKHTLLYSLLGLLLIMQACSGNKTQSTADSLTKTPVTVNGKRESVINNPQDKYGKVATIPDPCIKCVIKAAQQSSQFKSLKIDAADNILYVVNWVKASGLTDTVENKQATNGLRLDISDKSKANSKIASFIYDNSLGKLFFVPLTARNSKMEITTDSLLLKRMRNTCYWGVASSK